MCIPMIKSMIAGMSLCRWLNGKAVVVLWVGLGRPWPPQILSILPQLQCLTLVVQIIILRFCSIISTYLVTAAM